MADYKEQYLRLFNHITDLINVLETERQTLILVQQEAEKALTEDDEE